jgi:hypothetical protein
MVRYIGKSTSGLIRPKQHLHPSSRQHNRLKQAWLSDLGQAGIGYEIVVLDAATATSGSVCWWWTGINSTLVADLERWWIAYGRALGWPLTNISDGGESGFHGVHTEETRAKMAAARSPHGTDLAGARFGRLVAIKRATSAKKTVWMCICDCGERKAVAVGSLRNGTIQSCGCLKREIAKGGAAQTPEANEKRRRTLANTLASNAALQAAYRATLERIHSRWANRTHCNHGHELIESNLIRRANGNGHSCRECGRRANRDSRARRKAA